MLLQFICGIVWKRAAKNNTDGVWMISLIRLFISVINDFIGTFFAF
jgi:hypothetical protein